MTKLLKIDLFTDVVCPWCLVGSTRLDQAIARLPGDVEVVIENHPFYLDPTVPPEGVDVGEMMRVKYGRDPKEMWERVQGEAKKTGIDLDLSLQPRMFNTAKAHTITRLSKPNGNQHELANAIAEAYFLEHRQINDDNVLADIAAQYGWDRGDALDAMNDADMLKTTEQLATDAASQGIRGVPFFIFGEKYALSGAQPDEVFDQVLAKTISEL
ncbi:MAG: DsbA family oxidoreductase [Devosia sp.]|nr:DsbA family oxidoreductase [Devosia sp.]